jgi:putative ABC transport system ATP-binding protein
MIKLEQVFKVYRTKEVETLALENVNIEVKKGEYVSVLGPSGCGKSTLLNVIGLLDRPSQGAVTLAGENTAKMSDATLAYFRNRTLGFVFQSFHLVNALNVIDNVELPLLYRKCSASERRHLAKEALQQVGLSHRTRHFPAQLSGGQCQRVAVARAVVGKPAILLADEPTGNLDSKNGAEIFNLLLELNSRGTTIVMVTHDENLALKTKRSLRFFDGRQTADTIINKSINHNS